MDNKFARLNYYEMLDLKPDAALFEIRHAYNAAMQIYQPESLVSYSFFSKEERKEILALIENAYLTLINENTRLNYDRELRRLGIIKSKEKEVASDKKPVCIFDINRNQGAKTALKNNDELKSKISQNQRIGSILTKKEISGADLKEIRNELEVLIEHIAQGTKIRIDYLKVIEEDNLERLPAPVFLKGFVKSYLKYLCVEPVEDVSARYMETLAGKKNNR